MQLATGIANLLLYWLFFCSCYGAPAGETRRPRAIETNRMKSKYSPEEDEFIINFVKNYPIKPTPVFGDKIWNEAADQLREIQKSNPSKFPTERSGAGLCKHFRRMSRKALKQKRKSKTKFMENDEVLGADKLRNRYTPAEDDFIIKELLKPTCTSMYSLSEWSKIKAQHDMRIQSKTPGFSQYRSISSLKTHFCTVLIGKTNQVPPALKEKFARQFAKLKGKARAEGSRNDDSVIWSISEFEDSLKEKMLVGKGNGTMNELEGEDREEDHNVPSAEWDGMLDELLHTPVDVNFDLLKSENHKK